MNGQRNLRGLFLLVLFVLGQIGALVHHTLVEHEVCPVDGQLVHGDHGHGDSSSPSSSMEDGGAKVVVGPTDADGEHGEHCSIPDSREPRKHALVPPSSRVEPLGLVRNAVSLHSQTFESGIPLFRLAPKQSPPQVA